MCKNRIKKLLPVIILACMFSSVFYSSCAQPVNGRPITHDPVMMKQGDTYYVYCTGPGITVHTSKDLKNWTQEKQVFDPNPAWAKEKVPGFNGHIWAPDIYYSDGTYYLYYSISSFGGNNSCIGLTTNKTLDPSSPDFEWVDHGPILESVPGRDNWNAIDPAIIKDDEGVAWMSFGSFWGGLKIVKLTDDLMQIDTVNPEWHTISSRPRSYNISDSKAGDGAVEAPFIYKKDKYYYLFVSFDYCCRGKDSDYKIMVGRSESVTGPYIDKEGQRMDQGGGTLVGEGNHNWYAIGHNSVYKMDGKDIMFFHGYDAHDEGLPKLLFKELIWDEDNWPTIELE